MKVLFIIKMIDYGDYLAVCYLSSIAKELDCETYLCILDNNNIFDKMEEIKPDIVAYSANILGYDEMVEVNKKIKEKFNFVSIMGGPHPTFRPDLFPTSSVDVFCIGEGELPFRDFIIKVKNGESFDDILNLITKNKINPVRNLIDNLDEIPIPDRELTIENSFLMDISKKSFHTSRGCPFSCTYCCNNYYNRLYRGKGKIVRRFSVDYVIREMKQVKEKYKMDFVKIGDDLFAYRADEWLEEFAEKYSKEISLPFNCYLRLDSIDDKLLSLLQKAGCYSVHLSMDSCSEHVREKVLGRHWKNINLKETIALLHKYNIKTWVNFMLAAPESTLEDDLNVIRSAKEAKIDHLNCSTTVPLRGTDLFKFCVEKGYVDKDYNGSMFHAFHNKSPLNCFSDREKDIRYNILCLGPIVSKMPFPLFQIGMFMIKHIPSNKLFLKIRSWYWLFSIKRNIFRIEN